MLKQVIVDMKKKPPFGETREIVYRDETRVFAYLNRMDMCWYRAGTGSHKIDLKNAIGWLMPQEYQTRPELPGGWYHGSESPLLDYMGTEDGDLIVVRHFTKAYGIVPVEGFDARQHQYWMPFPCDSAPKALEAWIYKAKG